MLESRFAQFLLACLMVPAPCAQGQTPSGPGRSTTLIPRSVLFAPKGLHDPKISPDGHRLAYLAPDASGTDKLWVRPVEASTARVLGGTKDGSIPLYEWGHDSHHIIFEQDKDGDERFHVYITDIASGRTRDLTPYAGVRAQNLIASDAHPNELLVGLNLRDPRVFDLYRVDLTTAHKVLAAENPGDVLSFTTDSRFEVRAATAFDGVTGETIIRLRDKPTGSWRDIVKWRFEDSLMFGQVSGGSVIAGFAPGDKSLYVVSAADSDTGRLVRIDATSGALLEVLAQDARSDVAFESDASGFRPAVMISPNTHLPEAVAFHFLQREWTPLDPEIAASLAFLSTRGQGFPTVVSRDRSDHRWLVQFTGNAGPARFAVFNRLEKTLQPLTRPEAESASNFAHTEATVLRARDGTQLVSYLTRPKGRSGGLVPLVLYPHGGPWWRDDGTFDPVTQLLADRGYAVLQVNFRGSIGLGKALLNAGNNQIGLGTQNDLDDAIQWAIDRRIADPKRIAILGYSFGGYATLRALSRNPERFACGVDVVGPSDLGSLISTFAPWMQAVKSRWIRRIGNVVDDQALRRELSPLYAADKIRAPLLVGAGAQDPRVPIAQSDAMVTAARSNGAAVTYIVYPDEGHGFDRPENNLDFFGRVEEFLAQCLHGSAEPWTPVPGSTPEVK